MKSWKDCEATGKRSYPSKRSARMAMVKASNRIRAYPCNSCHGWHVTKERHHEGARRVDREKR